MPTTIAADPAARAFDDAEVARYIADMCSAMAQLASLPQLAELRLLLEMASLEAETLRNRYDREKARRGDASD